MSTTNANKHDKCLKKCDDKNWKCRGKCSNQDCINECRTFAANCRDKCDHIHGRALIEDDIDFEEDF